MEHFIGKICPYCKTELKEGDSVKTCPSCGIPHHENCWMENGGCTTFGCSGQQNSPANTPSAASCPNCGASLNSSQLFCEQCGTPRGGTPKRFCGQCGAVLPQGHNFCPQCGCRADSMIDPGVNTAISQFNANIDKSNRRKKNKLPVILTFVVILLAGSIAGGYYIYSAKQEAEKYLSNAEAFASQALKSGAKMEEIGNEIQDNWRTYINDTSRYYQSYSSAEDAVFTAQENQEYNISYVESHDSDIERLYSKLQNLPKNSDYEDIKEAIDDIYDAYVDMYDCVIDVSGNYSTFVSEFGDADSEFSENLNHLSDILEDYD